MKKLLLLALCTSSVFADTTAPIMPSSDDYTYFSATQLPNPKLTPGVTRQVTQDTLCTTSTKLVRHTTYDTKKQVYAEYGLNPTRSDHCSGVSHSCYEVDHLIPLEIGGADVKENLWPQLYDGINNAHDKDHLENYLHKQICANKITMQDAQTCISKDWIACKARFGNQIK